MISLQSPRVEISWAGCPCQPSRTNLPFRILFVASAPPDWLSTLEFYPDLTIQKDGDNRLGKTYKSPHDGPRPDYSLRLKEI